MRPRRNPHHKSRAQSLREHMTRQERHLWYDFLQDYPVHFYKQRTIGKYIVDFYCESARLIIELDGSQHYSQKAKDYDARRTAYLETYGLKVIRFSNLEVKHAFDKTCKTIHRLVQERKHNPCGNAAKEDLPEESQECKHSNAKDDE